MKSISFITGIFLAVIGCQKDSTVESTAIQMVNTAPVAIAGADRIIQTAQPKRTETYLLGIGVDKEYNIASYKWEKISGPVSGTVVSPKELITRVDSLDIGEYQFRLTVTDTKGLTGSDTVQITVVKFDPVLVNTDKDGEISVSNLKWIYPWGPALEIKDFKHLVPANKPFKVFVQRITSTEWINVSYIDPSADSTIKYDYFVETRPDGVGMYNYGSLYIFYYGKDLSEPVTVKITY